MQIITCDVGDIDILEANGLYKLHFPATMLRPDTKEPARTLAGIVVLTPQAYAGLAKQIIEHVQQTAAEHAAAAAAPPSDPDAQPAPEE